MDDSKIDTSFLGGRVTVVVGDITQQRVDEIVNAANSTLLGGGGVDGAIYRVWGAQILDECRKIRCTRFPEGLPTGEAVITTGGNLPAPYVIHTVGPIKGAEGGREAELLASCYWNSLALAVQHNLGSVAFPSVSTGAYRYPREEAGAVSSRAIEDFLTADTTLREVRLVFYDRADAMLFLKNHKFSDST